DHPGHHPAPGPALRRGLGAGGGAAAGGDPAVPAPAAQRRAAGGDGLWPAERDGDHLQRRGGAHHPPVGHVHRPGHRPGPPAARPAAADAPADAERPDHQRLPLRRYPRHLGLPRVRLPRPGDPGRADRRNRHRLRDLPQPCTAPAAPAGQHARRQRRPGTGTSTGGVMDATRLRTYLQQFEPKLWTTLREGYTLQHLRADAIAGLTVAIVALPLAMALAIASGATPEKGLHTAIIAGFLISALGGSRVQIGGPTAAFIPVVFVVIQKFGYGGLVLCTLLAGLMLIAAGLLRLGTLMKYMQQPVITGFTAGIAVSIFSSQVKDALGLQMAELPAEFVERWTAYARHIATIQPATVAMTALGLGVIVGLRYWKPKWPGFLIALLVCTAATTAFALPTDTIGSRFGQLPSALPTFDFPHIPFERTFELLPSAFTIAF